MDTAHVSPGHEALISRLRQVRAELAEELANVRVEDALKGSSWSLADVLRHIRGRPFYLDIAERIIRGEEVSLPRVSSPEEGWQRLAQQTLGDMDAAIKFMESLTEEQLACSARRGDEAVTVADIMDAMVAHYEEHLAQIRQVIIPSM